MWLNENSFLLSLHIDNGIEFFSNDLQAYFRDNGMEHQHSCVETPQQNGVAEHKHRHLLEIARVPSLPSEPTN